MTVRGRLKKLEQVSTAGQAVDVAAVLNAARNAIASGIPRPPSPPIPPEWEHSRNELERRLFEARRRVGY